MIHTPQPPQPPSLPQTVRSPPLVVTAANNAAAMTDKFPRGDGVARPTAFSAYQPLAMTAASVPATTIRRPSPPLFAGGSTLLTPTMPVRPIPIPAATVGGIIATQSSPSASAFRRTLITPATIAITPSLTDAPVVSSAVTASPSAIDTLTGVVKKSEAVTAGMAATFPTPTFTVDPNQQYTFGQHSGALISPANSLFAAASTTSIIPPTPMAVEATVVPGAIDHHNTTQSPSESQSLGDAVVASLTATLTKSSASGTSVAEVEQILQQSHQRRSSQPLQTLVTTFANAIKLSQTALSSASSSSSPPLSERTMSFDECAQLLSLVVSNMEAAEELASPSSSHSCPNCSSSNKGSRWSPSDDTAMLKLIDSGLDFSVIAAKLKRTVRALKDRYCLLKKNKSSLSSSSAGGYGHSADHHESGSHRHFSRDEDDVLDGDESSTSSGGTPDKKRSRQRGHHQREHRGDRQRSTNKRVKVKKRDNAGRSTYEDDETRAHDRLSAGSSSDSEDEHQYRHRPLSLPSSAAVPLSAVVSNQTPASPSKHSSNGTDNNGPADSNLDVMDESSGHRRHHSHQHNSGHHTHHHNRRRSSHSHQSSLSPASPPHLDEMDVSSDDDDRSVTSDDRSSRSSISRDDETSALDSLTKLSHMTEFMEKPQVFRQQSATSLLVAVANM